jgi:hypothetical protein
MTNTTTNTIPVTDIGFAGVTKLQRLVNGHLSRFAKYGTVAELNDALRVVAAKRLGVHVRCTTLSIALPDMIAGVPVQWCKLRSFRCFERNSPAQIGAAVYYAEPARPEKYTHQAEPSDYYPE